MELNLVYANKNGQWIQVSNRLESLAPWEGYLVEDIEYGTPGTIVAIYGKYIWLRNGDGTCWTVYKDSVELVVRVYDKDQTCWEGRLSQAIKKFGEIKHGDHVKTIGVNRGPVILIKDEDYWVATSERIAYKLKKEELEKL